MSTSRYAPGSPRLCDGTPAASRKGTQDKQTVELASAATFTGSMVNPSPSGTARNRQ